MATGPATLQRVFINAAAAVAIYYRPPKLDTRDAFLPFSYLVPYEGKGPIANRELKSFRTSLGDTQKEMLNRLGKDPAKFLQTTVNCVHGVPMNDIPLDKYAWASDDGPMSHFYCVGMRNRIYNVDEALKPDGQFFLRDFGNFYGWNGVLRGSDPESNKLLKEYNALEDSAARLKWLAQNRAKLMATYYGLLDKKEMLEPGDWFFMGESLVEFKAAGWFEGTDANGKKIKTFAVVLRPGPTHPFAGWIVHGYSTREEGIIESWVVGGGSAYTPGLDWGNSLLGVRLWPVTKQWTVEQINFEQMQRAGKVPLHMTFVGRMATNRPDLMKASMYYGKAVGMGGPVGIWFNQLTGRREPVTLDPKQEIQIRDDSFRGTDMNKWMDDTPYGENPFSGAFETIDRLKVESMLAAYFKDKAPIEKGA